MLTVLPGGVIELPPDALDRLEVSPGDQLILSDVGGVAMMLHAAKLKENRLDALHKIQATMRELVPPDVDMVEELLAERREEFRREEEKYARLPLNIKKSEQ